MFDGVDLDVIRLFSCAQLESAESGILFAADPAGFSCCVQDSGEILVLDHDGGRSTTVAESMEAFIGSYLFGERAAEFGGSEWYQELVKAKIAT